MSRVMSNTTLRRATATALIVLAGGLSACGDDSSSESAAVPSTPAPITGPAAAASTTPAETTPAKAKPANTTPAKAKSTASTSTKDAAKSTASSTSKPAANKPLKVTQDGSITVQEGADPAVAKDVRAVVAALTGAGFKPRATISGGEVASSIQVDDITMGFYETRGVAAKYAKAYTKVFIKSPKNAKLIRSGSRVYFISTAKPTTAKEKAEFTKVTSVADEAVGSKSN